MMSILVKLGLWLLLAMPATVHSEGCQGFPNLSGQTYNFTFFHFGLQQGSVMTVQGSASFFNQVDVEGNASDSGQFVQINLNNDSYKACAFVADTYDLFCISTEDGSKTDNFAIDPESISPGTCVPTRITRRSMYGPSTVEGGEFALVSLPAAGSKASSLLSAAASPWRCSAYPRLDGLNFSLTASALSRTDRGAPDFGAVAALRRKARFFNQRDEQDGSSAHGRFLQLSVEDDVGTSDFACMFVPDGRSLVCASDGVSVINFVVDHVHQRTCSAKRLSFTQSGNATAATAAGQSQTIFVAQGLGAVDLRQEEPGLLRGSSQLGGDVRRGIAPAISPSSAFSTNCRGYPTLAGQSFALTNFQLLRQSGDAADAALFQLTSTSMEFFDQRDETNRTDDRGQYVQINFLGVIYKLCMFTSTYTFQCTESYPYMGGLNEYWLIDPGSVNQTSCVPDKISLVKGGGWSYVGEGPGGSLVRKMWVQTADGVRVQA